MERPPPQTVAALVVGLGGLALTPVLLDPGAYRLGSGVLALDLYYAAVGAFGFSLVWGALAALGVAPSLTGRPEEDA